MRSGFLVIGICADDARVVFNLGQHDVPPLCEFGIVRAAEHQLERLAARAHQTATDLSAHAHAGHASKRFLQFIGYFRGGLRALVPGLQKNAGAAGVHFLARPETTGHAWIGADDRLVISNLRGQDRLDFLHLLDGVIEAGTFRPIHRQLE